MTASENNAKISELLIELSDCIIDISHYNKVAENVGKDANVMTLSLVMDCMKEQVIPNEPQIIEFNGSHPLPMVIAKIASRVPSQDNPNPNEQSEELSIHYAIDDKMAYRIINMLVLEKEKEKIGIIKDLEKFGVDLTGLINF